MRNAPVRLVRSVDSQLSSVSSRRAAESPTPALFTSTSTPPKRPAAGATAAPPSPGPPPAEAAAAVVAWCYERTWEIGHRHALPSCSWGHAGDGNLNSTFMIEPGSADELERARAASEELFALAVELGGSISGEHGLGYVKS